jgi:hypothetical protein
VGYVLLGIHQGVLRVYVRGESSGDDVNEAEDSAYELLVHAVNAVRPSAHDVVGSVSFFAAEEASVVPSLEN